MQAVFYTFSKRKNSTKRPSTGGTTYTVTIKEGSGVVRPRIVLKWNGSTSPAAFNYAYISDFGRYYWVEEWTFADRCWTASLRSDPLASAKTQIGSASKLITRSATKMNNDVADTIYPAKTDSLTFNTALSGFSFAQQLDYGKFVVGIVGQGNTFSAAGVGYIVCTGSELQQIINSCFTETAGVWSLSTLGSTVGEVFAAYGDNLMKSIQNPVQFINSITWLPFTPATSGQTAVKLGRLTLWDANHGSPLVCSCLGNPVTTLTFNTGSVLATPISTNSGKWRLMEPYSRYTLVCPPFGSFPLNGAQVVERNGVVAGYIYVDCMTGQAVLECTNFGIEATAQLGIPIRLSGNTIDYAALANTAANAVGSIAGAGIGLAGAALTGGVSATLGASFGGLSSVVSGITSTAAAAMPQAVQGGIGGGLAACSASRHVQTVFYDATDEDIAEHGRPFMEVDTVSSHPGFLMCSDGEIAAPLSDGELSEIEAFLKGGFFYE